MRSYLSSLSKKITISERTTTLVRPGRVMLAGSSVSSLHCDCIARTSAKLTTICPWLGTPGPPTTHHRLTFRPGSDTCNAGNDFVGCTQERLARGASNEASKDTGTCNRRRKGARKIANRNLTREEWHQFFPDTPYHATFNNLPAPPEQRVSNTSRTEIVESPGR
jgi:hypothetical protein